MGQGRGVTLSYRHPFHRHKDIDGPCQALGNVGLRPSPNSLHPFLLVSISYPQEGMATAVVSSENCLCRFNPRSHAGNDLRSAVIRNLIIVSIHAPTRRATLAGLFVDYLFAV